MLNILEHKRGEQKKLLETFFPQKKKMKEEFQI
jgi:hypothetical protein